MLLDFEKYNDPKGFEFVFFFIQFGWFYELDWYLYIWKLMIGWDYFAGFNIEWNPAYRRDRIRRSYK